MIVLDASAAVDYFALDGPQAEWTQREIEAAGELAVPEVFDLEVMSAVRRLVARRVIPARRGSGAIADMRDLDTSRWSHATIAPRIWSLRLHLTPYDAAYVALAEALDAPLVTTDRRLARSQGHSAQIRVFAG